MKNKKQIIQYLKIQREINFLNILKREVSGHFDELQDGKYKIGGFNFEIKTHKYETPDTKTVLQMYPDLRRVVKTVSRKKVKHV